VRRRGWYSDRPANGRAGWRNRRRAARVRERLDRRREEHDYRPRDPFWLWDKQLEEPDDDNR